MIMSELLVRKEFKENSVVFAFVIIRQDKTVFESKQSSDQMIKILH